MLRWLSPGDMICDAVGLPPDTEHRIILRMFANVTIWGIVAAAVAFTVARAW